MQLVWSLCLASTLLYTGDSLQCVQCTNKDCTATVNVNCTGSNSLCQTLTTTVLAVPVPLLTEPVNIEVTKGCSTTSECKVPLNTKTELSFNMGYARITANGLCCDSDNCNSETLPGASKGDPNGLRCAACENIEDTLDGVCSSTVDCVGLEDRCFSGTVPPSTVAQSLFLGCVSINMCEHMAEASSMMPNVSVNCYLTMNDQLKEPLFYSSAWRTGHFSGVSLFLGLTITKLFI